MPQRPRADIVPGKRTRGEENGDGTKAAGSDFGKGFKAISYTVASPGRISKPPNKREDKKQEWGSTLQGVASQEFKKITSQCLKSKNLHIIQSGSLFCLQIGSL